MVRQELMPLAIDARFLIASEAIRYGLREIRVFRIFPYIS
jgi:hypothetical protein